MFSTSTLVLLSFKIHWCIFTVGKRNLDLFMSDIGDNIVLNLYLMLTLDRYVHFKHMKNRLDCISFRECEQKLYEDVKIQNI